MLYKVWVGRWVDGRVALKAEIVEDGSIETIVWTVGAERFGAIERDYDVMGDPTEPMDQRVEALERLLGTMWS